MQTKLTTITYTNPSDLVPQPSTGNIYQDTSNLLVSCDCQSFQVAKLCCHINVWRKQCGFSLKELHTFTRVPRTNPFFADEVRPS
jgi:hypothetical protein